MKEFDDIHRKRAEAAKKHKVKRPDRKLGAGATRKSGGAELLAEHTVQAGDTLSDLALKYYGNASRRHYMYLYNTNKDIIGKDPDNIQVGMELKVQELPERLKGEKVAPPEGVTVIAEHTVVAGETLSSIAQKYYKDTSEAAWMAIYEANKDEIGDNPNVILVGMHFFIPKYP
jgi:nucleoid-associated protein YgaU